MSRSHPSRRDRLDRRNLRTNAAAWTDASANGIVACAHYEAADAGAEVLAGGGNAADAAVATALALNVCEPAASGLGGMAMVLAHGFEAGDPVFLEGACTAPAAATPELVASEHRYRGYRAVAVPGAAAAWSEMHARFGCLPLTEVVQPAIRLARRGHRITPLQHQLATDYQAALLEGNAADLSLDGSGEPLPIGTIVPQPRLADTIERLGRAGLMDFYVGDVAQQIAADMRANDGFVASDDLRGRRSRELKPIAAPFLGSRLFTAGPPAGGLALAQLAAMVTALGRAPDPNDPDDLVRIVEMIQRVRQDRRNYRLEVGADEPGAAAELFSAEHAHATLAEIQGRIAASSYPERAPPPTQGPGETSHICVMDARGGTVSMTVSIERSFGSACRSPELGFLYNGYLRGFKIQNQRHPHFLQPGAFARSNAAPTIVLDGEVATLAIGATGSERMVSSIFTTLLRLQREPAFAAVAGPRVHGTPDGGVLAEMQRLPETCQAKLRERYEVTELDPYAFAFGGLQLTLRSQGTMIGVGEPRRDGSASAPMQP